MTVTELITTNICFIAPPSESRGWLDFDRDLSKSSGGGFNPESLKFPVKIIYANAAMKEKTSQGKFKKKTDLTEDEMQHIVEANRA